VDISVFKTKWYCYLYSVINRSFRLLVTGDDSRHQYKRIKYPRLLRLLKNLLNYGTSLLSNFLTNIISEIYQNKNRLGRYGVEN
jgi:hypothetical protein